MIAEKDPYIKSAYDQLQRISQDEQKRLEYEAREKAILARMLMLTHFLNTLYFCPGLIWSVYILAA